MVVRDIVVVIIIFFYGLHGLVPRLESRISRLGAGRMATPTDRMGSTLLMLLVLLFFVYLLSLTLLIKFINVSNNPNRMYCLCFS